MIRRDTIYLQLIFRCVLFYFILVIALRIMGKREVGELSVFDIVIYLVMSELLALAVSDVEESIWKAIIPIVTLAITQIAISFLLLKNNRLRDIFDGKAVILIHNGLLNQQEMKKQRYNIDDLLAQLRIQGCSCLEEVQFAVLENSGELSILKKGECLVIHPTPLIQDKVINETVLLDLKKDKEWLYKEIRKYGYESEKQIFICMALTKGLYILEKNNTNLRRK